MFYKKIIFILIALLIIPLTFAESSITLLKENYQSLETLQGTIELNENLVKDINTVNLKLKSSNGTEYALSKNVIKVNSTFYLFYFDLPKLDDGNYNVNVTGLNYLEEGVLKKFEIRKTFAIKEQNLSVISFKP